MATLLTKDVCLFIAYCVTEFETVFRGLIFWQLLCLPPIAANIYTHQIHRGSYMNAHVLLNLIKELGKSDKV